MAILTLQLPDEWHLPEGYAQEYPFMSINTSVSIGAGSASDFRLPEQLGVKAKHAMITRSNSYHMPVLVNLAGNRVATRVNGRRVVRLKVLRHRDAIQLGEATLIYWELVVNEVKPDSHLLNRKCLVCYDTFQLGDRVITCPRCESADHHRDCWFYLTFCARSGCEYPVYTAMQRGLARWVRFESLEDESPLVKEKKTCGASNPQDQRFFLADQTVAYCPNCETPYHSQCWFLLTKCPRCGENVAELIEASVTRGKVPKQTQWEEFR